MSRPLLSLSLLFFSLSLGCGGGGETGHEGMAMPSGAICPTDSALTYESFGKEFFTSYCTECHSSTLAANERQGAPSDHNFDSLELIRAVGSEHIDLHAAAGPDATNTEMPPNGPLPTDAERKQLGEWLACGMP